MQPHPPESAQTWAEFPGCQDFVTIRNCTVCMGSRGNKEATTAEQARPSTPPPCLPRGSGALPRGGPQRVLNSLRRGPEHPISCSCTGASCTAGGRLPVCLRDNICTSIGGTSVARARRKAAARARGRSLCKNSPTPRLAAFCQLERGQGGIPARTRCQTSTRYLGRAGQPARRLLVRRLARAQALNATAPTPASSNSTSSRRPCAGAAGRSANQRLAWSHGVPPAGVCPWVGPVRARRAGSGPIFTHTGYSPNGHPSEGRSGRSGGGRRMLLMLPP